MMSTYINSGVNPGKKKKPRGPKATSHTGATIANKNFRPYLEYQIQNI